MTLLEALERVRSTPLGELDPDRRDATTVVDWIIRVAKDDEAVPVAKFGSAI